VRQQDVAARPEVLRKLRASGVWTDLVVWLELTGIYFLDWPYI
jgi:hypothetical protein